MSANPLLPSGTPALPDLSGLTHWHEMTMRISDWLVQTAWAAGRNEALNVPPDSVVLVLTRQEVEMLDDATGFWIAQGQSDYSAADDKTLLAKLRATREERNNVG